MDLLKQRFTDNDIETTTKRCIDVRINIVIPETLMLM